MGTVHQYSTFPALSLGLYDGLFRYSEILQDVDLGIGTYEHLDGEMILVDGELWYLPADGHAARGDPSSLAPFAIVTKFVPSVTFTAPAQVDFDGIVALFNERLPPRNLPVAVRIDGVFDLITFRSCPPQQKPYPTLANAAASAAKFDREGIAGTIAGFFFPGYLSSLNLPAYHLHFVSRDRTTGGHVLAVKVTDATFAGQYISTVVAHLPAGSDRFAAAKLNP
jgi:acetolactate decarboxylase